MKRETEHRDLLNEQQQRLYDDLVKTQAKYIARTTPMVTYNELIAAILFYGCIAFLIGLATGWYLL